MRHKLLLCGATLAMASFSLQAQKLGSDYIAWPESQQLATYVAKWNPASPIPEERTVIDDENFFISRVAPKARFTNVATQVNPDLTPENSKKILFWVPIGDAQPFMTNAIQNGVFDSEVFSMWSYLTHYGNWTSPSGWVPGAFADAAHKNGVAVSGVASIPWGALASNAGWRTALNDLSKVDKEKLARFLLFHGVNGLGYNSEFNTSDAFLPDLRDVHAYLNEYMKDRDPLFENVWYDGTNDKGTIQFDNGLGDHNKETFGDAANKRTSLFLNYNWNSPALLSKSVENATAMGRTSLDLYAGFNMQGGEPHDPNWDLLAQFPISIGLWGAHQQNMIWQGRNSEGSSPEAMQATYAKKMEIFFTNANRNPADKIETLTTTMVPGDGFHGLSTFTAAQSSLKWDIASEPFITYFNLGNGKFTNWKGERIGNSEWYSLGVQDYLPTWRWWWADKFLGRTAADVPASGLTASLTWEDAYMGGSCLKIDGTSSDEYLHLFKTEFKMSNNDVITVRYKHSAGTADVALILSAKGSEGDIISESDFTILSASDEADRSEWVEKTFKVSGKLGSKLRNKEVALVGLHFSNASGLELYVGEFSIKPSKAFPTPQAPQITRAAVLGNNHFGVDGKVIFNMASTKALDEPVYNIDVNTSLFKLYAQEEGGEPVYTGMTTSWAGLSFAVPSNGSSKVRFGVSAVALDFASESEIAWSDYCDLTEYVTVNDIALSQTMIKPGEPFSIDYVDPRHTDGTFTIYNTQGEKLAENTGHGLEMTQGLPESGGYDLVVNDNSGERRFAYYIQITGTEVGALPRINSLTVNGGEPAEVSIQKGDQVTLGYTGREADGVASRGINLHEAWMGVSNAELHINPYESFSVAAWVKFDDLPSGLSSFLTIENRKGGWPMNNWGFFWSRLNQDGTFLKDQIDTAWGSRLDNSADGWRFFERFDDTKLSAGAWSHVVFVFEYDDNQRYRIIFYVNGVKQTASQWCRLDKSKQEQFGWLDILAMTREEGFEQYVSDWGENTTDPGFVSTAYPITLGDWIAFGGTSLNISAMSAVIDDFQVWDKAMDQADVNASMKGLDGNNLPENVLAYWDFETDPSDDFGFAAKGKLAGAKCYRFQMVEDENEGQANQTPVDPTFDFDAGSPFIPGSNYKVVTTPSWENISARVDNATGSDTEGSAKISFRKDGDYTVELVLSNSYGKDTMSYPVIKVTGEGSVATVAADGDIEAYTVDDAIFVRFAEAGNYDLSVCNAAGVVVARTSENVEASQSVCVKVGMPGVYVLSVARDGKIVRNVKLLKK